MTSSRAHRDPQDAAVDLYWIPLGAGGRSVRFNGVVYEAMAASIEHRRRCDIYHSVLAIALPSGRFMVEMTPVPDALWVLERRRCPRASRPSRCGTVAGLPVRSPSVA